MVRAKSARATIAAAAPELVGQHIIRVSGSATMRAPRTSSTPTSIPYCAFGLREALRWFFTDTIAICSTVVPYFLLCARKISANISGIGAEGCACDGRRESRVGSQRSALHLLESHRQRHIDHAGPHRHHRLVKGGRTGRARILDVDDWDAGDADAIEQPLAGRDPLHRVAAAGHSDRRIVESRIGEGGVNRLRTEILEGFRPDGVQRPTFRLRSHTHSDFQSF